ncbi:MAG: hypothetical protein R3C13_01800 [Hyphomonas sp.]|uniref:hypothetical protein n=1 Tax=Hyphomonas sp. TaxID=87 RepID=UPI0035283A7F
MSGKLFNRQALGQVGIGLLFFLPLLSGVIGRAVKGRPVYNGLEFETLLCAGARAARGETRYPPAHAFSCPEYQTEASFLYIPWSGDASHALTGWFGIPAVTSAYAVLYFAAILAAIWIPFFKQFDFAPVRDRIPFAAALTGSIVLWGNVAGVIYGLLAVTALMAPKRPLVFVAAVVFAASIKQVWLCLLVVVMLMDMAAWKRWGLAIAGAVAGLVPTVLFVTSGSSEIAPWLSILSYYAVEDLPGQGFLGWLRLAGVGHESPLNGALWLVFAGVTCASALGIAEGMRLTAAERVWLGLAVGGLLVPRLVSYEFFLFAPGMVVVLNSAVKAGMPWMRKLVFGACWLCLLFNVADLGDYAMMPMTLACFLAIVITGAPRILSSLPAVLPFLPGPRAAAA